MSQQYNGNKKPLYNTRLDEGMWMRNSYNIEEKQSSGMGEGVPLLPAREQELIQSFLYVWLQPLLEHIASYFGERIAQDDVDLLSMSLDHLYRSIDKLYATILPTLAAAFVMNEESQQRQYTIWIQLRQSKKALERIEILCHLLSGTLTSVLSALDASNSSTERQESKRFTLSATLGARAVAFAQLQHQLEEWQHGFVEQQPLLLSIMESIPSSARAEIVERGWDVVLLSAVAIFGDILPDIQGISEGDDEAAATLFLDLAQQTDQILLQAEAMLEPFSLLIKQYALTEEI